MTMTDSLTCDHGMPNPAACVECMNEGKFIPRHARKVWGADQHSVGGYAFNNDCTVQSIVNALGVTYTEAVDALETTGAYTPGKGCPIHVVAAAINALGVEVVEDYRRSVGSLVDDGGTFIVSSLRNDRRRGHAYVVEAGHLVNSNGYERRGTIRAVLKVVG